MQKAKREISVLSPQAEGQLGNIGLQLTLAQKIKRRFANFLRQGARYADPISMTKGPRTCPICGFEGLFRGMGIVPRPDARCPQCGSLERHRLLKLMLDRRDILRKDCRLLHFAPESCVSVFLMPRIAEYTSADLYSENVDLKLNIECIAVGDRSFDVVLCSHVLEHVNDSKALLELFRILKPGGVAILAVPIVEGWDRTYENPEITGEADRLLHFGQNDHVRLYGRDFRERVRQAGFQLDEFVADGKDTANFSLVPGDRVFIARKPRGLGGR